LAGHGLLQAYLRPHPHDRPFRTLH
jgi:hypothetical protein